MVMGVSGLVALASSSQAQVIQTAVGSPFSMFAGQNFSAWTQQGNANWQIVDHQALMNQGAGWLIGKLPLTDFEIETDYWLGEQTQASLFVRCINTRFVSPETAYQINLSDNPIHGYGAGSLVGIAKAPRVKTQSRWNTLKVSARGAYLNVWLNGQAVVNNVYDTRFANGPIALSVEGGEFRIRSFNVTIPGRW